MTTATQRPHMCPECRAGKRHISSNNATRDGEPRIRVKYRCERCGWESDRRRLP